MLYDEDTDFNEELEEFCNDDYEVNAEQRMILVGSAVRDRIGSVVLWLREQGIDVSVVEFTLFKNSESELYLDSKTVVPTSSLEKFEVGDDTADEPWKADGRAWHLQERTKPETATLVEKTVTELREIEAFETPSWRQKFYIALRIDGKNRLTLTTRKNSIRVELLDYPLQNLSVEEIAEQLKIPTERISLEFELHHGNPGIQIFCYPEEEPSIKGLVKFVQEIVSPTEDRDEVPIVED